MPPTKEDRRRHARPLRELTDSELTTLATLGMHSAIFDIQIRADVDRLSSYAEHELAERDMRRALAATLNIEEN